MLPSSQLESASIMSSSCSGQSVSRPTACTLLVSLSISRLHHSPASRRRRASDQYHGGSSLRARSQKEQASLGWYFCTWAALPFLPLRFCFRPLLKDCIAF